MDQTAYFEQMRQKRRSEILETARRMILDQGLFSFSMQGLAQTLDVSTVTLYKYYKNSIAIIEDLYQATTGTLFQFPDLFPTQKKPEDLALEYISLILDDMICRREDFRLVMTLGLYIYPADPVTEILQSLSCNTCKRLCRRKSALFRVIIRTFSPLPQMPAYLLCSLLLPRASRISGR